MHVAGCQSMAVIVTLQLVILAAGAELPCELLPSPFWTPEKEMELNEREKIVSTIYENVSVVVDSQVEGEQKKDHEPKQKKGKDLSRRRAKNLSRRRGKDLSSRRT